MDDRPPNEQHARQAAPPGAGAARDRGGGGESGRALPRSRTWRPPTRLRLVLGLVCLAGAGGLAALPAAGAPERARIELLRETVERVPADTALREFLFRLPAHVQPLAGSELNLILRAPTDLLPALTDVEVSLNGLRILGTNFAGKVLPDTREFALGFRAGVPEGVLAGGWNQLTLHFVLRKTAQPDREWLKTNTWSIARADAFLTFAYERTPLAPGFQALPGSLAEDRLLRPAAEAGAAEPVVAVLLPSRWRDAHLRGCAVVAARLGQLGYLTEQDCRLAPLSRWTAEAPARNGVLLARADELEGLDLPTNVAARVADLRRGQGLLAEWLQGEPPVQRRWVLASGADDAGLEKAVLALGDAAALTALATNPAVIETGPLVSDAVETLARPSPAVIAFKSGGGPTLRLRGFRSEAHFTGWRVPPAFEVAGGRLNLKLDYPKSLTNSHLEVLVNGLSAGRVSLNGENHRPSEARLALPKNVPGRDPMLVGFRAVLDSADLRPEDPLEEQLWVTLSGDSTLESTVVALQIQDLSQCNQALARDSFLRRAAFLVPADAGLEDLKTMFDLALHLGRQLPTAPLLWPEACGYAATTVPPAERLQGRSVLLLGSMAQWKLAFTRRPRLALDIPDGDPSQVRLQGRRHKVSEFEPSLVFLQMLASPWSGEDPLLVAGGWRGFTLPALPEMFRHGAPAGRLFGNLCAMDTFGRTASYDTRQPLRESFAERLKRRLAAGLNVQETNQRLREDEARALQSARLNRRIFQATALTLLALVLLRVFLHWRRSRGRRKALRHEKPLGSPA